MEDLWFELPDTLTRGYQIRQGVLCEVGTFEPSHKENSQETMNYVGSEAIVKR